MSDSTSIHSSTATVQSVIESVAAHLDRAGADDPRRTASDVIAALLEVPRSWPAMNRDASLDSEIVSAAARAASRIAAGAPFAYAVGTACFRHLNLVVDQRVLIPRPETEVLVGEILERMQSRTGSWGVAVDIGTGSGAIALALASEGKFDRVIATDVSEDALSVARANARASVAALNCEVEFRRGSLISPVRDVRAAVIVSNPPYVSYADADRLPRSVRDWEPPTALFSSRDGLEATAGIVRDGAEVLVSGGLLAIEVDERRASLVAELMMHNGAYSGVGVRLDLAGRERFVLGTRI